LLKIKLRDKILIMVIAICLFSIISISLTSYVQNQSLADYSRETNYILGNNAVSGAQDALLDMAHDFVRIILKEQSSSCNNMLDSIKFNILLLEGVVTDILNNPEDYPNSRPIMRPSEAVEGIYCNTYSLPGTVAMTPEIERELKLLSNTSLLMPILAENPNIIELYVGLESGLFYNYTTFTFENPEYDARTRPWYIAAKNQPDEVIFTEVYADAFGTGMVLTAAKAIFDSNGNFMGVAALDILLENLKILVEQTQVTETGYTFIINEAGMYIVHPDMGSDGVELFLSESDLNGQGGLAEGYRHMMNGEDGFVSDEINGDRIFLVFSPISVANWSIGSIIHEEELLYLLKTLTTEIDDYSAESEQRIEVMSSRTSRIILIIVAIVVLLTVILAISVSKIISTPIGKLTRSISLIKTNKNEVVYGLQRFDEIGTIANAVQDMKDSLIDALEKVHYDALTGIYNRRFLEESLCSIVNLLSRCDGTLSVMMIDVDFFKKYNDTYGHDMGDVCLKSIAQAFLQCLERADDFVARYGGEEFAVILPNTDENGAKLVAQKLLEAVRLLNIPHSKNKAASCVTVSIGVTTAKVTYPQNTGDYIKRADEALYISKQDGRNRYTFSPFGDA